MAIDVHYSEVMDVIDRLFVYMFNGIASRCGALHKIFNSPMLQINEIK